MVVVYDLYALTLLGHQGLHARRESGAIKCRLVKVPKIFMHSTCVLRICIYGLLLGFKTILVLQTANLFVSQRPTFTRQQVVFRHIF